MEVKEEKAGLEKAGLLNGIQILDLADEKASFCSKLLADLGAYVIKVERPGGDAPRKIGPFYQNEPSPERSFFFWYHNTNKWGITLDIEQNEGKKIFFKLLKKTDIVVETFLPGYLDQLGLGFDVLREVNSRLILISVTGFGQNGPRSRYPSCDSVASAFGGQMYVSGSPSTPPLKPFGEQSYYTASLYAAIAILLALRKRDQCGKGEHIDISLQEAVLSTLDHVMLRYFNEKRIPKRQGSLYWNDSFFILPCKDGHILMAPFQQWETLVEWLDREGMAGDLKEEEWHEEEYRLRNFNHILEVLERWTKTHTAEELFELGQPMRFPWAPVYSPRKVLKSPQLKERNFFIDVDHPEMGTSFKYPGIPYPLSPLSLNRSKRAPLIGEDNVRVYQKVLGLSKKELQRLSSSHVI
jgi:crotonobetainyl-CoA:carnitine CoA-transferase CaiB-like acyl-CoA transferase